MQPQTYAEKSGEILSRLESLIKEAMEAGISWRQFLHVSSEGMKEYRAVHPRRQVRQYHKFQDGERGGVREKAIDIPIEALSPRAKRLYLAAMQVIEEENLQPLNPDKERKTPHES